MKTVRNIKKITSAMKLVAASKLRQAQQAVEKSRGIIDPLARVLGDAPSTSIPKTLTVPVTSDRGLCGGINTTVCKYTRLVNKVVEEAAETDNKIVIIGDKGRAQLTRDSSDKITLTVADVAKVRTRMRKKACLNKSCGPTIPVAVVRRPSRPTRAPSSSYAAQYSLY